jgi:multidrug efflux pump
VRKKIGDMRNTLPAGVQGPFFNDEFGDVYGVIYALEAEGFSYAELKTLADDVRQQLLRVPDVAKVELFGVQDEKLYIEISQKRLAQLGLDLNQVLAQLGRRTRWSAGAVQTPLDVVQVRVAGQFHHRGATARHADPRQFGQPAALGDIAEIKRGYVDPPAGEGAPPGQGSRRAGRLHGQGRRHHPLGKALRATTASTSACRPA